MELNVTSFFSFTTYLTGLAFLIMAWTNVEYKYRQRLYMSWLSKKGMLITVTVVGVLTLAVALHRNLDKNDKANKVYISKRGTTLWQKKTDRKQRSAAA